MSSPTKREHADNLQAYVQAASDPNAEFPFRGIVVRPFHAVAEGAPQLYHVYVADDPDAGFCGTHDEVMTYAQGLQKKRLAAAALGLTQGAPTGTFRLEDLHTAYAEGIRESLVRLVGSSHPAVSTLLSSPHLREVDSSGLAAVYRLGYAAGLEAGKP